MLLDLSELLSRLTGKTEQEIRHNLKKNADGEELKSKEEIAQYLEAAFSSKFEEIGRNNLGRGKREALTTHEKNLKSKFDFTSDLKGLDLVEAILNRQIEQVTKGSDKELTVEIVQKHPAIVQQLVQDAVQAVVQEKDAIANEYTQYKTAQRNAQLRNQLEKTLRKVYVERKAKMAEPDSELFQKQVNLLLSALDMNRFQLDDTSHSPSIIPLNEDGQPLRDKYQNPVSIEDYLFEMNPFGVREFDPNKGGSGSNGGSGNGGSGQSGAIQNQEQLLAYMNDQSVPIEQRNKVFADFIQKN